MKHISIIGLLALASCASMSANYHAQMACNEQWPTPTPPLLALGPLGVLIAPHSPQHDKAAAQYPGDYDADWKVNFNACAQRELAKQ